MSLKFHKSLLVRLWLCLIGLLSALTVTNRLRADPPQASAGEAAFVQPFIGETTFLIVKVDTTRVELPDLAEKLKLNQSASVQLLEQLSGEATRQIASLQAATASQAVYATVGIPMSTVDWPIFLFLKESPELKRQALLQLVPTMAKEKVGTWNGVLVAAPWQPGDVTAALAAHVPSPRQELAAAFEAVKDHPIQILILPPDYVRRTVVELMPELPWQLGGGSSRVLTEGCLWAAVGFDPAGPRLELIVQSTSEEAAGALAKRLPTLLQEFNGSLPDKGRWIPRKTVRSILEQLHFKLQSDRVRLDLDLSDASSDLPRFFKRLFEIQHSQANSNAFKQILLAMHNYHDSYKSFPPAEQAAGRSLSWRVHLLPYLGEQALYHQFQLDQPWDSAHNQKLIEKMPSVYQSRWQNAKPGHTTFLAPVGDDTVYGGKKSTALRHIRDGSANTVVLVEATLDHAVPWTAPRDYRFDPKDPSKGLYVGNGGRVLAARADGSVVRLPGNLKPDVLLRLFRKSDGQVVDWDAIWK